LGWRHSWPCGPCVMMLYFRSAPPVDEHQQPKASLTPAPGELRRNAPPGGPPGTCLWVIHQRAPRIGPSDPTDLCRFAFVPSTSPPHMSNVPLRVIRASSAPMFGLAVAYSSPGALERIGPDWDWIWIDAQHGDLDFRETAHLLRVADLIQRPALVRIPGQDPGWIGKVLDAGAAGVIVPMVESVQEAQAVVNAAKFPPQGNRSYGGRRAIDRFGRGYYKTANRDTLLILQLESNDAVALADSLAGMEGVDGLFLGPDDLMIRCGRDVDTPKSQETIGSQSSVVTESCRKYGKLVVGLGVSDAAMSMALAHRYDLVVGGGDVGFLAGGSSGAAQKIRSYFNHATGPESTSGSTRAASAPTAGVAGLRGP
jgi:4-hydroxy-2-oxoheptanedioate aldolase